MTEEKALKIVEQPFGEGMVKSTPYEAMLQGREEAYETCLAIALKSTKPQDWVDYGGEPFLQEQGARRIALRFGISLLFDKDAKNNPIIAREDFSDEWGSFVKYRASGRAVKGDVVQEGIGSCTSRDDFFGWEWIDPEDKLKGKKPKPLYAVVENAEKKAVTNLWSNLVKSFLGIKGFKWEDLAKYGITKEGKKGFVFKNTAKAPEHPAAGKRPFWKWQGKEGLAISARPEAPLSDTLLAGFGMHRGKTGVYTAGFSEGLWSALEAATGDKKETVNDILPPEQESV